MEVGGPVNATGGSGALIFSAGADSATVTGGSGGTTVFGANGSDITYLGSAGTAFLGADLGNETINASASSTNNNFIGGSDPAGTDVLTGGGGNDTFTAGAGSQTLSGGAGSNNFIFYKSLTRGGTDVITDFSSNDAVFLSGYDNTVPALLSDAAVSGGATTAVPVSDILQIVPEYSAQCTRNPDVPGLTPVKAGGSRLTHRVSRTLRPSSLHPCLSLSSPAKPGADLH